MEARDKSSGRLVGKVAIVTGAGTGIGRAAAKALAAEGVKVALWGRRAEPLESCVAEIVANGGEGFAYPLDVADPKAVEAAVADFVGKHRRLDIMVNNAGTNSPRRLFSDSSIEDFDRVVQTNLYGVFYCIRSVLPTMRAQKDGLIVNVASGAALQSGLKSGVAYGAAKRGVVALTQMVNAEEWQNGIRCTTVYPGDVDTPIMELRPKPPSAEFRAKMLMPEDLGDAIVFLASLPPRALVEDMVIKPTHRSL